jgi:hypothetical protein
MARALRNRLPTAITRVRSQVRSYGVCGWVSGTESSIVLPCFVLSTAPHSIELPTRSYIVLILTQLLISEQNHTGLKVGHK